mgnify:CR=1 FL=1
MLPVLAERRRRISLTIALALFAFYPTPQPNSPQPTNVVSGQQHTESGAQPEAKNPRFSLQRESLLRLIEQGQNDERCLRAIRSHGSFVLARIDFIGFAGRRPAHRLYDVRQPLGQKVRILCVFDQSTGEVDLTFLR